MASGAVVFMGGTGGVITRGASAQPSVWWLILGLQDNYLIEIRGDVQESLPTSMDESSAHASADIHDGTVRVYYMVHPSVDLEGSSSMP